MITDIFGMANYKKNEKEILELASKEICEQLSEELNKKIDSIVIHVDVDRRYIWSGPAGRNGGCKSNIILRRI